MGFRAVKSLGWQWQKTRVQGPPRALDCQHRQPRGLARFKLGSAGGPRGTGPHVRLTLSPSHSAAVTGSQGPAAAFFSVWPTSKGMKCQKGLKTVSGAKAGPPPRPTRGFSRRRALLARARGWPQGRDFPNIRCAPRRAAPLSAARREGRGNPTRPRRTGGNRAHATTPVPSPELPHRDPGGEAKNLGHRPGGLHNVLDHGPGPPSRGYLGAGQALQRVGELPGGRPHRDGNTAGVRGPPVPPEGPEHRPLPRHAVVGDPIATAASAAVFLILGPGRPAHGEGLSRGSPPAGW